MISVPHSLLLTLLLVAATPSDRIDDCVAKMSADPLWLNGAFPELDLPQTATTEEVVAKVFQMTGFPGKGTDYKILKTKEVRIKGGPIPDTYTAVLLKTGTNEEVVLLQYSRGWWSRVLSVP